MFEEHNTRQVNSPDTGTAGVDLGKTLSRALVFQALITPDNCRNTPSHLGIVEGNLKYEALLLEYKVKANLCSPGKKLEDTPLHCAMKRKGEEKRRGCVEILLETESDPNVIDIDGMYESLLLVVGRCSSRLRIQAKFGSGLSENWCEFHWETEKILQAFLVTLDSALAVRTV